MMRFYFEKLLKFFIFFLTELGFVSNTIVVRKKETCLTKFRSDTAVNKPSKVTHLVINYFMMLMRW